MTALRSEGPRLQPGAATLLMSCRNAHVESAAQACLTRWILPQSGLHDIPMMISSTFRLDTARRTASATTFCAQLRRGKRGKTP